MTGGFALLWGSILRSSLWIQESKETKILWVTLLALRDAEGVIRSSVIGLADAAKLSVDECKDSLSVLLAPDPNDSSGVAEGRRLRVVEGGWEIVNHEKYRFSTEAKRAIWRAQKAEQRENEKKLLREYQEGKKDGIKKVVRRAGELAGRHQGVNDQLAQADLKG